MPLRSPLHCSAHVNVSYANQPNHSPSASPPASPSASVAALIPSARVAGYCAWAALVLTIAELDAAFCASAISEPVAKVNTFGNDRGMFTWDSTHESLDDMVMAG
ncbi:hypothetical protein N431DRAFT_77354 [Stipitochalara longipes BDJ]|nr:hypothetical protein N431DRAFT_77354 [Stipitochalara longipes BDJ]